MDWQLALKSLHYAHGVPLSKGTLKSQAADFIVQENLGLEPPGEGEHWWLQVRKTGLATNEVSKTLANFAGVQLRDIGFSGMKDKQAVTSQWFSVWKPKGEAPPWLEMSEPRLELLRIDKGNRKIKRATHRSNHFEICIRDLSSHDSLESRLQEIQQKGVPNYFGEQRFGYAGDNLRQLREFTMPEQSERPKNWSKLGNNKRSMLLSVARAWLFNQVLSARISSGRWDKFMQEDIANLNGSNSWFIVKAEDDEGGRLQEKDIHPTAPLWGVRDQRTQSKLDEAGKLGEYELEAIEPFMDMAQFLESKQLKYQRRATRLVPQDFKWDLQADVLRLSFSLQAGQYATSVIREIVNT